MANAFSKEEIVMFEDVLEGYNDLLVMSKLVATESENPRTLERADDTVWFPQPYIATSQDGTPGTTTVTYPDFTQLSVPARCNISRASPWILTAKQLRDMSQQKNITKAAINKLASDINVRLMDVATAQGTLVVKRTNAPGTYDDIAECDTIMNEQGIPQKRRLIALSSRAYNGMANNLATASRSFGNAKSDNAYEDGFVGDVAGFETYKLDYSNRILAAVGAGITMNTTGAMVAYVPAATLAGNNVDNRYQTITVSSSAGVVAGDAFTVAGVEAVHHETKTSTGQLKTFRVISVPGGGTTLVISPPMINGTGGAAAAQYQNISVVSTSATAAITFLNTAATSICPFWHYESIKLFPGTYGVSTAENVMNFMTDNGVGLQIEKFSDIDRKQTKYRADVFFGVNNMQPEMNGILLFNQV